MRSLPLYHPIGGKSPTYSQKVSWNVLRIRCTAILLIVALSLTTLWLLTIDGIPWNAPLAPFFATSPSPTPNTSSPHPGFGQSPPSPPSPFSSTPQNHRPQFPLPSAHVLGKVTYDSFLAPDPAHALADMRVRPIQVHAKFSDACIDAWVLTGRWGPPCKHKMGESP
ncbi:hypothetical protein B0H13DRAFT_2306507 [Mycena leptocephala]|nr:hypothetical protein B0H13DRAFT_2306507 [Mycena leptocephala]